MVANFPCLRVPLVAVLVAGLLPCQVPTNGSRLDPTTQLHQLSIGRSGDAIHVVGIDYNLSPTVRYARSTDGGRTWPVRERLLASGDSVTIAVAGDRVFVACVSGGTRSLLTSLDAGATWQSPVPLPPGGWLPRIHVNGNDVNVFCIGGALGWVQGLYLIRSADGGISWWLPVDLAVGLPTGTSVSERDALVVAEGSELHLFWNHRTPQFHLAHQSSFDGGATWLPAAQSVTNAVLVGAGFGAGRLLVQASSTLWTSTNHGVTWSPLAGHGLSLPVALAMDGSEVLAVEASSTGPGQVLRTASSSDAGLTWLVSPWPIAGSGGEATAAIVGDVRFVWSDQLGSSPSGAIYQSDDRGGTWRQIDGAAGSAFLPGTDGCIVLTEDQGVVGLWAWVLEGHTRHAAGNAGTAGVVPSLTGRGLTGLGRTFYLDLERALGGTLAGYVFGFGATAATSIGPNTRLLVAQPIGPLFVMTSGASGQAGTGTATFAVPVPNDPSCVGLRLLSQAFVVDPGAPDGFCATAARESWIR